jgi:hypothetical protein
MKKRIETGQKCTEFEYYWAQICQSTESEALKLRIICRVTTLNLLNLYALVTFAQSCK